MQALRTRSTRQPPPKDGLNREDRRAKRGWRAGGPGWTGWTYRPQSATLHARVERDRQRAERRRARGRWAA